MVESPEVKFSHDAAEIYSAFFRSLNSRDSRQIISQQSADSLIGIGGRR